MVKPAFSDKMNENYRTAYPSNATFLYAALGTAAEERAACGGWSCCSLFTN